MMYDIIQLIKISFHAAIFALLYYILIMRFLDRVAISRLTKSSFRLELPDLLDLTTAYLLATLACLYILFSSLKINAEGRQYIDIFNTFAIDCDEIHYLALATIIIAILFIGRILTKIQGSSYGRLHFSSIFVACSLYISYDIMNAFIISVHTWGQLYIHFFNKISYFVNFSNQFKEYLFAGVLFLSLFCEMCLSIYPPPQKSISTVLEKFPSDFKVTTGINTAFLRHICKNVISVERLQDTYYEQNYNKILKEACEKNKINSEHIDKWVEGASTINWRNFKNILFDEAVNSKLEDMLCENSEPYVFRWNQVPGADEETLRNFIIKKTGCDWPSRLKFEKNKDNNAIYGRTEEAEEQKTILNIDTKNKEVVLGIGNDKTIELRVREDGEEFKIYDKSNIKRILCVTRSMNMIDNALRLLLRSKKIKNIDIRIIVSPPYMALKDFDSAMKNTPISLGDFINFKNFKIDDNRKRYCERFLRLEFLIKKYLLKSKVYYLRNVVFLIVEFDEDCRKEILFSVRDSLSLKRQVGLNSIEPHVIAHFENMFYSIWVNDIPSFGEEFEKLINKDGYLKNS